MLWRTLRLASMQRHIGAWVGCCQVTVMYLNIDSRDAVGCEPSPHYITATTTGSAAVKRPLQADWKDAQLQLATQQPARAVPSKVIDPASDCLPVPFLRLVLRRDPRWTPGALGYAAGEEPDLSNLTCSLTLLNNGRSWWHIAGAHRAAQGPNL